MIMSVSCPCSLYAGGAGSNRWIWTASDDPAPKNRFTWFRKVITVTEVPEEAVIFFTADSNARLWVNGHLLRRKVTRYFEERITADPVDIAPYIHRGQNVIVVLHHNWGDITTFQRSSNRHAGLYISGDLVNTDDSWRWCTAPGYFAHEEQIVGVNGHPRIRYPQIVDVSCRLGEDIHNPDFDDSAWQNAIMVEDGPWPDTPLPLETPPQREYPVTPQSVVAAGTAVHDDPYGVPPSGIAGNLRDAKLTPSPEDTQAASGLCIGGGGTITGKAGESKYVTVDFGRPVHGYPFIEIAEADKGIVIDSGYGEIPYSLYDGSAHVRTDGWINTEGVVGKGYADRCITAIGRQSIEFPDERTARWLTLHMHFPLNGSVRIQRLGIVKSQYPIDPVGDFSCGDEIIDRIVRLMVTHAEITMTDSYIDTPGREDGQWIEDARPRAQIAASWFGDIRLRRLLIRIVAESQGPGGNFHPFPPSNFPAYPASYDWSVQWVAALYDDYMWTGDTEYLARYHDTLVRYWDNVLTHVDEEGLWRTNRIYADIRVGVHCADEKQSSGIVTPWIIERLRWSADMADALGDTPRAETWRSIADRMTHAFRRRHIVPASSGVPAHVADIWGDGLETDERGFSQAGQTVALTTGLMTSDEAMADIEYAFGGPDGSPLGNVTRWNNPTYFNRALQVMSAYGFTDRAVRHLIERCEPYLPGNPRNIVPLALQGANGGPLPEYWIGREDLGLGNGEPNTAQPIDPTGSHGWNASPLLWLHDTILGVRIIEPGGDVIRIAPQDGGLPYVAGHVNTPNGVVWVYWDPSSRILETAIPASVTAHVAVPAIGSGRQAGIVLSAGTVRQTDTNEFVIEGEGTYRFTVR